MVSGFSEEVELGEIGTIKESDTVVMRVRLRESPAQLPADLKWRGIALDYYDGRAWRRRDSRPRPLTPQESYFKVERSAQSTQLLTQTYFLEALSTDVVFACRRVLALSSDLGSLRRDAFDNFFTAPHRFQKIRYTAVSDITHLDPSLIPASSAADFRTDAAILFSTSPPGSPNPGAGARHYRALPLLHSTRHDHSSAF